MKYLIKYNEHMNTESIKMDSEFIDIYNSFKQRAKPLIDYFKSLGFKIQHENTLEDLVNSYLKGIKASRGTQYIDATGYTYKNELEKKIVEYDVAYSVKLTDPSPGAQQLKKRVDILVELFSGRVIYEDNSPLFLTLSRILRSECKNGRKLINILNGKFSMILGVKNNSYYLFDKNKPARLINLIKPLKQENDMTHVMSLSQYIFKYGTDEEVKEMWDIVHTEFGFINLINHYDKTAPKAGIPDTRGILKRIKSLTDLTDDDIKTGLGKVDNMRDSGFFDSVQPEEIIIKTLNSEMEIYEKYFRSYSNSDDNITSKEEAYDENDGIDGFDPSWVAMFNYNIHSAYGMFQAVHSGVDTLDIDSGKQETIHEQRLFINLNIHEGLIKTFFEGELSKERNLYTVLQESEKKGFKIQIVFEVINDKLDVIISEENIYDNRNLYLNMMVKLVGNEKLIDVVFLLANKDNKNMLLEWWNRISAYRYLGKIIKQLKQYPKLWRYLCSFIAIDKKGITKLKKMDDTGFSD